MSTNSNPSIEWLQDLLKQLDALWGSLDLLQVEYNQAKANFESLDTNSSDSALISQRQQAEALFRKTEKALNDERNSLISLENQYEKATAACEAAMQRMEEKKDIAFDISTTSAGATKGMEELLGAYGSVIKVAALCGIETNKMAAIQEQLNNIITVTTALQNVSGILSAKSAFQTQVIARVTTAWTAAQTFLNTQLGISVGLSKALMASGIGLLIGGIGLVISKIQDWRREEEEKKKQQEENLKETRKNIDDLTASVTPQLLSLKKLQYQWGKLGDDINAKKKFISDSQEEFRKLGVEINNIADAEKLMVSQSQAVMESLFVRAKGIAAYQLAIEGFKKIIAAEVQIKSNEQSLSELNLSSSSHDQAVYHDIETQNRLLPGLNELLEQEKSREEEMAQKYLEIYSNFMKEADKSLEDAGFKPYSGNKLAKDGRVEAEAKVAKAICDMQLQNRQKEIDLMKESAEKKREQAKLNYDKDIETLSRHKAKLIEENSGNLPLDLELQFQNSEKLSKNTLGDQLQQIADNEKEKQKERTDEEKKELESVLNTYQAFTDKRKEIETKFNDHLDTLREARKKAESEGDEERVAQIDRSIVQATKEKGTTLAGLDLEELKNNSKYIQAFENLKTTSRETLDSLMLELQEAKIQVEDVLSPEQLREYNESIQAILDEFISRNPYQALTERKEELAQAEQELADAKRDLDDVQSGKNVIKNRYYNKETDKIDTIYLSAAEAAEKYAQAEKKVTDCGEKVGDTQKVIRNQLDGLFDELKKMGTILGGSAGEILSFITDIYTFVNTTIDGIDEVSKAGKESLSMVEKASVILTIISTAIQLIQKLSSLFSDSHDDYLKYDAKIEEINKLRDAVTDYELAVLKARQAEETWFAEDGMRSLKQARDFHDNAKIAYEKKADEQQAVYQNKKGGGWLTNSVNWVYNNTGGHIFGKVGKYDKNTTAAVNNLRIETRKASKGFMGSGIGGKSQKTEDLASWIKKNNLGDLFDSEGFINKDTANIILDKYGKKLVGQTKETLEELVALKEQYDEYKQQLREYVNSLYEPIVDNFVDSLWSWFDEGKDALDSFKEHASDTFRAIVTDMMKTIILNKVVGTFGDDVQELYDQYAEGTLNEQQLMQAVTQRTDQLMNNYEKNIPTLQNMMEILSKNMEDIGIDLKQNTDNSSQKATSRGFEAISQDTGAELNGRFTALQMAGETIRLETALHTQLLTESNTRLREIYSVNSNLFSVADDTRNTIVNSYLELQEIRENTGAIVKPIKEMVTDIKEIKNNISNL